MSMMKAVPFKNSQHPCSLDVGKLRHDLILRVGDDMVQEKVTAINLLQVVSTGNEEKAIVR